MKHLKTFTSLIESEGLENMGEEVRGGHTASNWIHSSNELADFDITWENENGEEVTAAFIDNSPFVDTEDGEGYSEMETLPGTSSDGKEYVADVRYTENAPETFEIVSVQVIEKQ
jgi:hypothetical protein